jgi:hypothetical protein
VVPPHWNQVCSQKKNICEVSNNPRYLLKRFDDLRLQLPVSCSPHFQSFVIWLRKSAQNKKMIRLDLIRIRDGCVGHNELHYKNYPRWLKLTWPLNVLRQY